MSLDKNGAQLKYGIIQGEQTAPMKSIGLQASLKIPAGGCFATITAGLAAVATSATALIYGWIYPTETGLDKGQLYETTSPTAGAENAPFIPATSMPGVVVRLPVASGTFVVGMIGETCDLVVASLNGCTYAQGAALGTDVHNPVIIIGGDLVNNKWVDVVLNPANMTGYTGV